MQTIFYIAAAFMAFCTLALLVAPVILRPTGQEQRILAVVSSQRPDQRTVRSTEKVKQSILERAGDLRGRLGISENVKLKNRLYAAGLRNPKTSDLFFAIQFVTPLLGVIGGSFMTNNTVFWVCALGIAGYVLPDFVLTQKTTRRKNKIRRSMPDAIDLLVICVDAGLGMDQALLRVGQELAISHPEINEEFGQVYLEQRAGKPRLEAWQSLADRSKIEEFVGFVNMLTQADRFGTPIVRSLSRFSDELRQKRRQHAEEAATKTKIKIIFPLVLCIFPCLFIVLLAPAVIAISGGLQGMGN